MICKIKPKNILFIDDAEENINIAKKREWNVCLANGHELDKIKQTRLGLCSNILFPIAR